MIKGKSLCIIIVLLHCILHFLLSKDLSLSIIYSLLHDSGSRQIYWTFFPPFFTFRYILSHQYSVEIWILSFVLLTYYTPRRIFTTYHHMFYCLVFILSILPGPPSLFGSSTGTAYLYSIYYMSYWPFLCWTSSLYWVIPFFKLQS